MQKKNNGHIEVSDLVADAVSHAVARRSQVEAEESLTTLSDDEVGAIMGGLASATIVVKYPVVTAGILPAPVEEVI